MATSLVNNKYRITRRIGGGSFGEIYMGIGPNNEKVAVKFERHGTRCPQLRHEYKVYRELINCHGFCSVYHFGTQDNYNVMVMDLLGPSLEDLFNKCNRRFSLKTVLQLADQLLERVDTLHSRHLIHRDIKPANFVIGINESAANVYCVDFGLSKRYRHPKNLQHIPHRDGRSLTGTPRYASINNHLGIEQSRRDDLESIGYVLIYFLKGSLPWQGLKAKNAQKKYRLILEKKQQVSIAQLCQGCPSQFAEFLAYTRSLKFDAKPDIPYLRKLFRDLYHAQGCGAVPKLWDWDGIDGETSGANSTITTPAINTGGGAAGVVGMNPSTPMNMRPTTAAAVAGQGIESDLLLPSAGDDGGGGYEDDYGRPNTAGNVYRSSSGQQAGIGVGASGGAAAAGNSWGYSRQASADQLAPVQGAGAMQRGSSAQAGGGIAGSGGAGTGIADYGTGDPRRPHTAHGGRAASGAYPVQGNGQQPYPADGKVAVGYENEEDPHVVAGARGMMRYRRNRATSMEGQQQGQGGQPSAGGSGAPQQGVSGGQNWGSSGASGSGSGGGGGGGGNGQWAVYQSNPTGKAGASGSGGGAAGGQMMQGATSQSTQHLSLRKGGNPPPSSSGAAGGAGWQGGGYGNDRPKSAGISANGAGGGTGNGGGLVASLTGAGRPSSSTQAVGSAGNWSNAGGGANSSAAGGSGTGSNNLTYGSLKNRFLSGSGKNGGGGAAGMGGGGPSSTANNSGKSSKLFSLAR